jgi:hypothetical protein
VTWYKITDTYFLSDGVIFSTYRLCHQIYRSSTSTYFFDKSDHFFANLSHIWPLLETTSVSYPSSRRRTCVACRHNDLAPRALAGVPEKLIWQVRSHRGWHWRSGEGRFSAACSALFSLAPILGYLTTQTCFPRFTCLYFLSTPQLPPELSLPLSLVLPLPSKLTQNRTISSN